MWGLTTFLFINILITVLLNLITLPFEALTASMPQKSTTRAYVLGVGMTKFIKPRGKVDYTELGFEVSLSLLNPLTSKSSPHISSNYGMGIDKSCLPLSRPESKPFSTLA